MRILSLFSNVGFGEHYLSDLGHEVVVANELEQDRANLYEKFYPEAKMICGDVSKKSIKDKIIKACEENGPIDVVLATPPCQGFSIAHAKRDKANDPRNSLIIHAMELFRAVNANYMLIENVTGFAKNYILHDNYKNESNPDGKINILDFIEDQANLDSENKPFCFTTGVLNGKDFKTAQDRKRSITLISRKNNKGQCTWALPPTPDKKETTHLVTVRDAISNPSEFPCLESGDSNVSKKWHFQPKHNPSHIKWMKATKEGQSAYYNEYGYYPCEDYINPISSNQDKIIQIKKANNKTDPDAKCKGFHNNYPVIINNSDGSTRFYKKDWKEGVDYTEENDVIEVRLPPGFTLRREIYGFTTTYKRMFWDKPAPTVTMTNGSISSQNNVHPCESRVLTIREILSICGLPKDMLDRFACRSSDAKDKKSWKVEGDYAYEYNPSFIRKVLGEMFLPRVCEGVFKTLGVSQVLDIDKADYKKVTKPENKTKETLELPLCLKDETIKNIENPKTKTFEFKNFKKQSKLRIKRLKLEIKKEKLQLKEHKLAKQEQKSNE